MAGQVERSEMIDVVELKYQVVEVERQKYVCVCGGAVETAPGPVRAVDGGRLDNNRTERGLRGPVIGRRNHFGSKSARGPVVAATMYSLVESAKAAGVDPSAYLVEVATRAKRNAGVMLLPATFKVG